MSDKTKDTKSIDEGKYTEEELEAMRQLKWH